MRGAVHRFLPALGGLLLIGWGASYLTRPAPSADATVLGTIAAFDAALADAWQPVATLIGDDLEGGRILALDARSDTVVLAHPHAVSVLVGGHLVRRFGSDVVGAPEYIGRGAGIALTASGIALLDPSQHRVDFWRLDGTRTLRVALPSGDLGAQYGALTPLEDGVAVSAFRHGNNGLGWWIWRVVPPSDLDAVAPDATARLDTLLARYAAGESGAAFRIPLLAPVDGGFVLLDALQGRLLSLDAAGRQLDSTVRVDHPRFPVPEQSRQRVRSMSATMPDAIRRALELGEFAPSARGITVTADGRLLVHTADLHDAAQVELLTRDARPVGRLWDQAEDAQLFLVRGQVYRVREDAESYVIDRLGLRAPR
ncbi:MAG: hypothetical protein C0503_02610 [Gemmatimonas sp.]|nr:hypothetical protein [Gemmatimonas sp.]